MKVLVIDNYDSFTYNLVYILRQTVDKITVYRNDKVEPEICLNYDAIILSPGPGLPENAGSLMSIIEVCAGKVSILGVCLGHQAIGKYLGAKLRMLNQVFHGVQSQVKIIGDSNDFFKNVPYQFKAGRYHSWDIITTENENFEIIALSEDDSIMAIQNKSLKLYGIQFHPESILTPNGETIVHNFLSICKN